MSEDAVRIEWTPQEIFVQVLRLYLLQGIIRGSLYGTGLGTLCGLFFGPWGLMCGIPLGLVTGLLAGTVIGLIGGCVLGAFSVWWVRRHGGMLSEQTSVQRAEYRRWINRLAVGSTLLLGFLIPAALIVILSGARSWSSDDYYSVMILAVPVALAGFASSQATKKIMEWHEMQFSLPLSVMSWDETVREGVWPPAPIRPQDH